MEIDYAADAPQQTSNMDLTEIGDLVQEQIKLEDALERAEAQVEAVKEQLREIQTKRIPDLLKSKNLSEIRLAQGHKVILKDQYFGSIPVEKKPLAHVWLRNRGFGDLIKHEVVVTVPRGQDNRARLLVDEMKQAGWDVADKEGVHAQTLKAFVREQVSAGNQLPEDLFTVSIVPTVKIERKKDE